MDKPRRKEEEEEEEEAEDDDALSLSDLPLIHRRDDDLDNRRDRESAPGNSEDFDFGFGCLSAESEMCAADEVFFQGRILPLRHSFGSEKSHEGRRHIARSQSLDHSIAAAGAVSNSSRSSSISSQQSSNSSSSGGDTVAPAELTPPRTRNRFLSHSSPSPRIQFTKQGVLGESFRRNQPRKSSIWTIFRLGLVTPPPDTAFRDLRFRCIGGSNSNCGNFGSRSSSSSSGGGIAGKTKKIKAAAAAFLPGCRYCSVDAVDTLASTSRAAIFRRGDENDVVVALNQIGEMEPAATAKKTAVKKQVTRRRTFEWIKQLP